MGGGHVGGGAEEVFDDSRMRIINSPIPLQNNRIRLIKLVKKRFQQKIFVNNRPEQLHERFAGVVSFVGELGFLGCLVLD